MCKEDTCDRVEVFCRGWCRMHYYRQLEGRRMDLPPRKQYHPDDKCSKPECERPIHALGYCQRHYVRHSRGYDMDRPIRDYVPGEWSEWLTTSDGYIRRSRSVNGVQEFEIQHRTVMEELLGRKLLADESVHHRNGDRADNRPENLELWSRYQPAGQRVEDKLAWAAEILERYGHLDKQIMAQLRLNRSLRTEDKQ